jgi:hypothetical protein
VEQSFLEEGLAAASPLFLFNQGFVA